MKAYLPVFSGVVALVIDVFVFFSLMEWRPFGKGDSDMIWALPLFALIVLALTIPGLASALGALANPLRVRRVAITGVIANGVSLAIPMLFVVLAIDRLVLWRR